MAKITKLITAIFVICAVALPTVSHAATLYFSPSSASYTAGGSFAVAVYVSSADQAMNAASGAISFPPDLLEVVSLSREGSVLGLWVADPTYSNSAGSITFEGVALNPGFTGSSGKIATVTFRTKTAGNAQLRFSSGSVLANDGQGTNILTDMGTAEFMVAPATGNTQAPTPTPVPAASQEVPIQPSTLTEEPVSAETPVQTEEPLSVGRVFLNALFVFGVLAAAALGVLFTAVFVWFWYRFALFTYHFCVHAHQGVAKSLGRPKKSTRLAEKAPSYTRFRLGVPSLLSMFFVVILVLSGAYYINTNGRDAAVQALSVQQLQHLTRSAIVDYELFIGQTRQLLSILARLPQVEGNNAQECSQVLAAVTKGESRYKNAGVVLPNGTLWCSAVPFDPPVYLGDRTYFKRTLASENFSVGDYQVGRESSVPGISFGFPVKDGNGDLEAVVFVTVDLSWLEEFATHVDLPPDSSLLLVDNAGVTLVRYPDKRNTIGKEAPEFSYQLEELLSIEESLGVVEVQNSRGVPYLLVATPLSQRGEESIHLIISVPKEYITEVVGEISVGNALHTTFISLFKR